MRTNLSGQNLKQYRLDKMLGQGGAGTVYQAFDAKTEKTVAIKVLHEEHAQDSRLRRRFLQEVEVIHQLQHPSIIKLEAFDAIQNYFYIVMEFLPAGDLRRHIWHQKVSNQVVQLQQALQIVIQIAEALDYAHQQNIFHRDVKPDNILLRLNSAEENTQIRAVLSDFGIVKLHLDRFQTVHAMGTFHYASPEQCRNKAIDGRSDLYSLGIVLYELTTGHLPFMANNHKEIRRQQIEDLPPAPRSLHTGLPQSVSKVIQKVLAKDPDSRFQTGQQMAEALYATLENITDEDIIHFATGKTVIDLITHLQVDDFLPVAPTQVEAPTTNQDQIIIAKQGQSPIAYTLSQSIVTIGRTQGNEIILDSPRISRHHARLKKTDNEWQIIDLVSSNGTYLDGRQLPAQKPTLWPIESTLTIGPYFLYQQPAGVHEKLIDLEPYQVTETGKIQEDASRTNALSNQTTDNLEPIKVTSTRHFPIISIISLLVIAMMGGGILLGGGFLLNDFSPAPTQNAFVSTQITQTAVSILQTMTHVQSTQDAQTQAVTATNLATSTFTPTPLPTHTSTPTIMPSPTIRTITLSTLPPPPPPPPLPTATFTPSPTATSTPSPTPTATFTPPPTATPSSTPTATPDEPEDARPINQDSDSDGLFDDDESDVYKTDPFNPDTDSDGLFDGEEVNTHRTDPLIPDTDADSLFDGEEVIFGTDPLIPTFDTDVDGLFDEDESFYGTDPLNPDTDDDTLPDGEEVYVDWTDPLNPDTDADGLLDGEEVYVDWTDPLNPDTDSDGLFDGEEVYIDWTNPLNPDTDADGLLDGEEIVFGTDPLNPDTDGDTILDGDELFVYGTDPLTPDFVEEELSDEAENNA